ncbi:MAG TPA: DUF1761 domain-containing protein [Gemmatimonadales bacterium]|jgi:MFS family permease|nr:DUF1761 domain-containing protein [Gemmatimonadales bacterium]
MTRLVPVLASAAAYWALGALWYSLVFGGVWAAGLAAHGIEIPHPTPRQVGLKLALTFVANVIAASVMGWLVDRVDAATFSGGALVGLLTGTGLAATGLAVAYTWENKPVQLYLVDAGYHVAGLTLLGGILAAWH